MPSVFALRGAWMRSWGVGDSRGFLPFGEYNNRRGTQSKIQRRGRRVDFSFTSAYASATSVVSVFLTALMPSVFALCGGGDAKLGCGGFKGIFYLSEMSDLILLTP